MRIYAMLAAIFLAVPALAQDKATIQSLSDQFAKAFNAGDAAAVAALYTEDAIILPPGGEMMKGRSAIQAFWKGAAEQFDNGKLTTVEVKPLGNEAAREIGTFSFRTKRYRSRRRSLASMWWSGRRLGVSGSSQPTSGIRTSSSSHRSAASYRSSTLQFRRFLNAGWTAHQASSTIYGCCQTVMVLSPNYIAYHAKLVAKVFI